MKTYLKTEGETDTWITPKYITEALGEFDLDPCEHTEMPWRHAKNGFTIDDDGLKQEWKGRVWLNPPFNRKTKKYWMKKMQEHKNGLMLIPASFEIDDFKKYVWGHCTGVMILDHRPYFRQPDGSKGSSNSGQTMCIIAYDEYNLEMMRNSNLGIILKQGGENPPINRSRKMGIEYDKLNLTDRILDKLGFSEYWDEHCTWGGRTLTFKNGTRFRIVDQEEMDDDTEGYSSFGKYIAHHFYFRASFAIPSLSWQVGDRDLFFLHEMYECIKDNYPDCIDEFLEKCKELKMKCYIDEYEKWK